MQIDYNDTSQVAFKKYIEKEKLLEEVQKVEEEPIRTRRR